MANTETTGVIEYKHVEEKIITIRDQKVLLDSDVAELYGVETKRINEAITNNLEKFPDGYILAITEDENKSLRSKFSTLKKSGRGQHSKYLPHAFTEKGLYMLATILKSPRAVQTTIAIVETFTKIRELSRTISELSQSPDKDKQKSIMQKSGDIIAELLSDSLEISESETSFEIDLALMKFKHTVKKKKKENDSETADIGHDGGKNK